MCLLILSNYLIEYKYFLFPGIECLKFCQKMFNTFRLYIYIRYYSRILCCVVSIGDTWPTLANKYSSKRHSFNVSKYLSTSTQGQWPYHWLLRQVYYCSVGMDNAGSYLITAHTLLKRLVDTGPVDLNLAFCICFYITYVT